MEIQVRPFNRAALKPLEAAMGDYVADIVALVECGDAQHWRVGETDYIVTVDNDSQGEVLVVLCSAGRDLRRTAPVLLDIAKRHRAYGVRFHAQRKGVARLINLPMRWIESVFLVPTGGSYGQS